jgi:murein DD-endopeptidase MepM/ murein hydrolase activator NlpD
MGAPLMAQVSREQVREELLTTIEHASARYRARQSSTAYRTLQEQVIANSKQRVEELNKEKRELRMKIAAMKKETDAQESELINLRGKKMALQSQAVDQREAVRSLIVRNELRDAVNNSGPELLQKILNGSTAGSLKENALQSMRRDALLEVRLKLAEKAEEAAKDTDVTSLSLHAAADASAAELETMMGRLTHLQQDYLDELSRSNNAANGLLLSQSQLNQVKNDIAEIHRAVLRMQTQLARLDERERRKSERSLIEMGIMTGKPGEYSADQVVKEAKQEFTWPVSGRVTAGFHDATYYKYFGIPHQGVDIAVPQGTTVHSAADGVVFVVREGGLTGYTYVLIGHASGFATLYGHLSSVLVTPGQTVKAGQAIGLSGGEPGTAGAGPTTTGQHLHFEVIQSGVNINPLTVLP